VKEKRLGDHVLYPIARIERTERILEDDLHVAAKTAQFGSVRRSQIDPVKNDGARSRFDEAENEPSQRAFAGTGFAHQAQRLAFMDIEGDIVHGADFHPARRRPPNGDSARSKIFVRLRTSSRGTDYLS
jgi:hypothetical protein